MYSLLASIINGITIDFVLKGLELSVTMMIISKRSEEVKKYILENLGRGAPFSRQAEHTLVKT